MYIEVDGSGRRKSMRQIVVALGGWLSMVTPAMNKA